MKPDFCTDEQLEEYLEELDAIRASGITNMFGAAPYLQDAFADMTDKQARTVLLYWMNTFAERHL